jgi:Family of unknown function (DUF6297)
VSLAVAMRVPPARAWRTRLRRARRRHRRRSLGDTLSNLYMLLWLVFVYGVALVPSLREHLRSVSMAPGAAAARYWIVVAVLLAGAGVTWQAMRTVGPLLATPAEQAWGLATPVDRRAWLLPRFLVLLLAGALGGAVATAIVVVLGLGPDEWVAVALAGGTLALGGMAVGVAAQAAPEQRPWPRRVGTLLMSAGAAAAALVVVSHYTGRMAPRPSGALSPDLAIAGVPLAAAAVVVALRTLGRLDAMALGAGAQLAQAAATSVVWLDPSLLTRVLELRRWRRVGRVRSRAFLAIGPGRVSALLQAELRRQARRPGALAICGALALAQYAVAVVAPAVAAVAQVIGAYLVAGRLASGLRAVGGSAALRRALGGREMDLRLTHLVVPALGAALWWVLTAPAGGPSAGPATLLLLGGIVAATYRGATRAPMSYGPGAFDTPLGLFPAGILLQLARGPDLLGVVIVLRVLLKR